MELSMYLIRTGTLEIRVIGEDKVIELVKDMVSMKSLVLVNPVCAGEQSPNIRSVVIK